MSEKWVPLDTPGRLIVRGGPSDGVYEMHTPPEPVKENVMDFTLTDLRCITVALSNIHRPLPVAPDSMAAFLSVLQKVNGYLVSAEQTAAAAAEAEAAAGKEPAES